MMQVVVYGKIKNTLNVNGTNFQMIYQGLVILAQLPTSKRKLYTLKYKKLNILKNEKTTTMYHINSSYSDIG